MRTHSKYFSFSKLAIADGASTVVRVAMVCNDLAIANSSMGHFKKMESNALNHIRQGAALYFVRMSCGHLREGIKAVEGVRDHPALCALVKKCDPRAQTAFADLCECLPSGRDHMDFGRYVQPIRNTVAFHYDAKRVNSALEDRANRPTSSPACSITIGEDIHSTRFEFADALLDTIVCRKLWGILDTDVRAEADRIADWCFQKSVQFLDFGDDFVRRFLLEHAA